ncbi:MAG: YjbE family putative metal transport protein [Chloroflexi bacterium]|nr:MAG: YjbE family putative metal transport protein [Chloroflexota bacterium]
MFEWLGPIGGILLVDLALSGDNALVIGAVASKLQGRQRWWAIMLGGGSAIILRIVFAVAATYLLQLALLQAIGGAILLFIAIRLLADRSHNKPVAAQTHDQKEQIGKKSFLKTLLTILLADTTMSLDNILAVGALAEGNLPVLVIGLLMSIIMLLIGSALISGLIGHLPWLLDIASLVLAWTASHMILGDMQVGPVLAKHLPAANMLIPITALLIVLLYDVRQFAVSSGGSKVRANLKQPSMPPSTGDSNPMIPNMSNERPTLMKISQRFRQGRRR